MFTHKIDQDIILKTPHSACNINVLSLWLPLQLFLCELPCFVCIHALAEEPTYTLSHTDRHICVGTSMWVVGAGQAASVVQSVVKSSNLP